MKSGRCADRSVRRGSASIAGFGFLSRRPLMVVLNVGEADVAARLPAAVAELLATENLEGLVLSGKIEMEIAALEADDRQAFLDDLGLKATARERFIRAAYELLDQISFLTSGEDEVRAWTIKRGTPAVKAAGKIHSDIERGFIRAEVVHYDDFVQLRQRRQVPRARQAAPRRQGVRRPGRRHHPLPLQRVSSGSSNVPTGGTTYRGLLAI